jgi:dephospho-CoA kinase
MSPTHAKARMAAQLTPEEQVSRADIVIENSGPLEDLARQVDEVWKELERLLTEQTRRPG